MAEKRMLTRKVTDADEFITLPSSAQALYLHLTQAADDDGFNNQIQIAMMKAHASTDDLKLLLMKRYIIQFDSGVIVIKHWRMANALQGFKRTPTAYKEEFAMLKIKDNGSYTLCDGEFDTGEGGEESSKEEISEENSIDEFSLGEFRTCAGARDRALCAGANAQTIARTHDSVISLFQNKSPSFKICDKSARNSKVKKSIDYLIENYSDEEIGNVFEIAESSRYLKGLCGNAWKADFEWIVDPKHFEKISKHFYDDRTKTQTEESVAGYDDSDKFFEAAVKRGLN